MRHAQGWRTRGASPEDHADAVRRPVVRQRHGRTEFLGRLIEVGRAERLRRIVGYISAENRRMITLATRAGFHAKPLADDPSVVEVTLDL
jgi:RimJ/RimL family protein N-acetyltransferase